MLIYTIGHSNRTVENFIQVLQFYDINRVIDIRRVPFSKKFSQFSRRPMEDKLRLLKIDYEFAGDDLGGFRTGGFVNYMQTNDFQQGMNRLQQIAYEKQSCLLCAEMNYLDCHRRFICDKLNQNNFIVKHILDIGKTIFHTKSLL